MKFLELFKAQKLKENGYNGVAYEALPKELQSKVKAAAQTAKNERGLTLCFDELPVQSEWEYGNDYNNAFIIDNDQLHMSFHRVGKKIYRAWFTGSGNTNEVAEALGLDRETAHVIREPQTPRNYAEMQLNANGPILGF